MPRDPLTTDPVNIKDDILARFRICVSPGPLAPLDVSNEMVSVPLRWLDIISTRLEEATLLLSEARKWKHNGYPVMRFRIDEWASKLPDYEPEEHDESDPDREREDVQERARLDKEFCNDE